MASILIVDDSPAMRQMVAMTLRESGHDVVEATDGKQALDIAQRQRFHLIMADVHMPCMDGICLIQTLRALPEYCFTPLLILTAESGAEKKQLGKAAGATGWIVKPFNPRQLIQAVKKALGNSPDR